MVEVTIVVPAYNEEERIGETLKTISNYLGNGYNYEVIVVDDGSTDATAQVVRSFNNPKIRLISNKDNRGKGFAVKIGVLAAQKEWILFSDADLSTPITELRNLFRHQDNDIVIGSRGFSDSKIMIHQPRYREWGGRFFNVIVRSLAVRNFKDTQCGFKLFKKSVAQKIFPLQTIHGFGFDVEILYIALKHGFTVKEVPVAWAHRSETKVSYLKDSLKMCIDLVMIRLNDIFGKYHL